MKNRYLNAFTVLLLVFLGTLKASAVSFNCNPAKTKFDVIVAYSDGFHKKVCALCRAITSNNVTLSAGDNICAFYDINKPVTKANCAIDKSSSAVNYNFFENGDFSAACMFKPKNASFAQEGIILNYTVLGQQCYRQEKQNGKWKTVSYCSDVTNCRISCKK